MGVPGGTACCVAAGSLQVSQTQTRNIGVSCRVRLNRDVAIKVLPAAFANDVQYMARFEREAQVPASLNHPNIATVYGIEQGALVERGASGAGAIMTVPLDMSDPDNPKAGAPAPYQGFSGNNVTAVELSPDGRWLAYSSSESGVNDVMVVPFPAAGQGGKWQVSVDGGRGQRWSRVGRELFYLSRDRQIMVVAYRADGGTFSAGKPRLWSETTLSLGTGLTNRMYDPAPGGKRILVVLDAGQTQAGASLHVTVLLNFFDELKRRIP